jgi:hypothetical protein
MGYKALSAAYKVYFPDTRKLRVYRGDILNEVPLLTNLTRRHTLLPEELKEWPKEAAQEDPTPETPDIAPAPSTSFSNKHVSFPTPPSSLSNYRTHIEHKKKHLDSFSDSDSDDDVPVAQDSPSPVATALVVPAPLSPVAPVLSPPVNAIFPIDNHPNSDSDSFWKDPEPEHMDQSEGINILTPPPSPTSTDFNPRDEEPHVLDTPLTSPEPGPPPQTPTGRPLRSTAKPSKYICGLATPLTDSIKMATASALFALSQIGTLLPSPPKDTPTTLTTIVEPQSSLKALASPQAAQWQAAMDDKMKSLTYLSLFESASLPPYQRAIPVKWVFKLKTGEDGQVLRHKARLVVCGFMQKNGESVDETYAPVSMYASLRSMVAHCCAEKIDITHLDIKNAFLNAPLDEIVWCDPSPGICVPTGHKLRLNKALYGLKLAPRAWNIVLTRTLLTLGFTPSTADPCLYLLITPSGERIFMNTYEDDLFLDANPSQAKDAIIAGLAKAFAIINLGIMTNPLGMEITWNPTTGSILITQSKLAQALLEDMHMQDCNPRSLPLDPKIKLTKPPRTNSTLLSQNLSSPT